MANQQTDGSRIDRDEPDFTVRDIALVIYTAIAVMIFVLAMIALTGSR